MAKRKQPELTKHSGEKSEEPVRRPDGTFAPGSSGCPGGRGLAVTRFARLIREESQDGRELVLLGFRIIRGEEMQDVVTGKGDVVQVPPSVREKLEAARYLREWGWGKALPASEMTDPEELPEAVLVDSSPQGLLTAAQVLLVRLLSQVDAQSRGGLPLSDAALTGLGEAIRGFVSLRKADDDMQQKGPAGKLTDADLKKDVARTLTDDELRAEVERRLTQEAA